MISSTDRSYYIGASDTKYVVGNWNTKTFEDWWNVKKGLVSHDMDNIYLQAGNVYEPMILDYMECEERDRQIIIGRLRVNLDGELEESVVEAKTFGYKENWKPPKNYLNQVQVEMFATDKETALIVAYGLLEEDYRSVEMDEPNPIDENRMKIFPVARDDEWIDEVYLPRLWYLAGCLDRDVYPTKEEFENEI